MGKISDARLIELLEMARAAGYPCDDEVPAHMDRAAEKTFQKLRGWVALGAIPPIGAAAEDVPVPKSSAAVKKGGRLGIAAKVVSVILAAALIGAGSYAFVPAVRGAVDSFTGTAVSARQSGRAASEYVIPDPGEPYELVEDYDTGTMCTKLFAAEEHLMLVQIAKKLPEAPEGIGEAVTVGNTVGLLYEVEGDRVLILRDGGMTILIKNYSDDDQELMRYAEAFAAANGM